MSETNKVEGTETLDENNWTEVRSDQSRSLLGKIRSPVITREFDWLNCGDTGSSGPYSVEVNGEDTGFTTGGIEVSFLDSGKKTITVNYIAMENSLAGLVGLDLASDGDLEGKTVEGVTLVIHAPGPGCGYIRYRMPTCSAKLTSFKFGIDHLLTSRIVFTSDKLKVEQG